MVDWRRKIQNLMMWFWTGDAIYIIRFFQMQEDQNIEYPASVDCLHCKESDTYSCQMTLTNPTKTSLYFSLTSTFGLFLKETTGARHIASQTTITLAFTIKSTNIISHDHQFVTLSISPSKLSQLCFLPYARRVKVQLKFSENFIDDPVIEALVAEDASNLLNEGYTEMWASRFFQARIKFEESFQLQRRCEDELFRMAYCSFALQDWPACLRDIEAALAVHPNNTHYEFLKIKALTACYGQSKSWEGEIIEECFKMLKNIEVERFGDLDAEEKKQLKTLISTIEKNPLVNRTRLLKKELIRKALSNFTPNHPISKWYSREELAAQLRDVLLSDQVEENATPEEVIDPISYEILQKPMILQSGHSFEEKSLQLYFQKNGFKDPITRRDISPQFIFPNVNLQTLIREHPRLQLWRQYEHDLLRK